MLYDINSATGMFTPNLFKKEFVVCHVIDYFPGIFCGLKVTENLSRFVCLMSSNEKRADNRLRDMKLYVLLYILISYYFIDLIS